MFIVRVLPIGKGIFKDELSFFSRVALEPGLVVSAPVRGKNIPAIVIDSRDAREQKLGIRTADFSLKKLPETKGRRLFSPAFIAAMREASLWHAAHESVLFAAVLSHTLLSSWQRLEEAPSGRKTERSEASARPDLLAFQAEKAERLVAYRNLAREAFARGSSVLILAPTIIEAETLAKELERGIENRVILTTSDIPKKKLIDAWNRSASAEPVLVVGTPFALSLPLKNLDTIVIERESARAYRQVARPHADMRRVAESFSKGSGARLILADFPLRVETRYRAEHEDLSELARFQARPSGSAEVVIVDARKDDTGENRSSGRVARTVFKALSEGTVEAIRKEIARGLPGQGGRVAVFAARRGIAPLTVCNDCGTPVADEETGTPMTLHKTAAGNMFLSRRSGAIVPAGIACKHCGSWNLVTLGIGVEQVFDELEKNLPEAELRLFTTDTAPTSAGAKKIAREFYASKGSVLVGTERMLPYVTEPVELAVVASVDSLLSLSAWRAHEHTLSILFYLRERAEKALIIETRKPEHIVMKAISSGNPLDFYRADIEERKTYHYPPFAIFVGLRTTGSRQSVEKARLLVAETFGDTDLVGPLPAVSEGRNEWSARAVIRVAKEAWPDRALIDRLKALPPGIEITIDPDEIV